MLGMGARETPRPAHSAATRPLPAWLTGLHAGVRHAQVQGLLLQALQQSLGGPARGPHRALLLGEGDVLVLRGAGGAGVRVPRRGAGLGGAPRAVVRAAANVHDAGDIDVGPGAAWGGLCRRGEGGQPGSCRGEVIMACPCPMAGYNMWEKALGPLGVVFFKRIGRQHLKFRN